PRTAARAATSYFSAASISALAASCGDANVLAFVAPGACAKATIANKKTPAIALTADRSVAILKLKVEDFMFVLRFMIHLPPAAAAATSGAAAPSGHAAATTTARASHA